MSDPGIPTSFTAGGHNWSYYNYDGGNRHQWYRAMTDAEVKEHTDGRLSSVSEIDFEMLWPVADYPVYMIELTQPPVSEGYTVTANRTYLGRPRPGQTDELGPDYKTEKNSLMEAIQTVQEWAKQL